MWFFNYFKSSNKSKIASHNIMHPEMVKIIRKQFDDYYSNK